MKNRLSLREDQKAFVEGFRAALKPQTDEALRTIDALHAVVKRLWEVGMIEDESDSGHRLQGVEVASGARRSEKKPPYHLFPKHGLGRIAGRWQMGLEKYGKDNYKLSLQTRESAYTFAAEAFNHIIDHALNMANGLEPEEDHLGAIGWGVMYLAEVEERFGCRWTELAPGAAEASTRVRLTAEELNAEVRTRVQDWKRRRPAKKAKR